MGWDSTKTWNAGDPALAVDMDYYVRDNELFLYGDPNAGQSQNNLYGYTYEAPAVGGSYEYIGPPYTYPSVERHGNMVHIQGVLQAVTASHVTGEIIAQLPISTYWPKTQKVLIGQYGTSGSAPVRIDVTPAGNVLVGVAMALNSWVGFDDWYSLL